MNIWIVLLPRLIIPLSILRFPLLGGILALALDYVDWEIFREFNHGDLNTYQAIDKSLDFYYLLLELLVASRFTNKIAKNTSIILFGYRAVGFSLFHLTQNPIFLVIFANVFEFFYLTYLVLKRVFKKEVLTSLKGLIPILIILFLLKLIHEYFLHINTASPWTENHYFKILIDLLK